ncbi:T9SS type A sorting domain-containing protein [Aquimarina sp. W85]|uniref:T9SS type A sorting domain-containing protein n=1 Tax=Aquimarina rhodophyticola TaxID=3342246 RepID=UPI00366B24DB
MKKVVCFLVFLLFCSKSFSQTYSVSVTYSASSDDCHAASFHWTFNALSDSEETYFIDSFNIAGNSFGNIGNTNNYTLPNYEIFSLNLDAGCEGFRGGKDCQVNKTDTRTREQLIVNSSLGVSSCNGFVRISSFKPNLRITQVPSGISPAGTICMGDQLVLNGLPTSGNGRFPIEAYHWEYSLDNMNWTSVATPYNDTYSLTATMQEIIGANHRNYLRKNIYFRLGRGRAFSSTYTILYSPCAPLLELVEPKDVSCPGNEDGWFSLYFDELIDTNDHIDLELYPIESNGILGPQHQTFISRNQFRQADTHYVYDWKPKDDNLSYPVPAKAYRIKYQYRKNGNQPQGFETYPYDITVGTPNPLTFSTTSSDAPCIDGQGTETKGSITITVPNQAGTPPYRYIINGGDGVAFLGNTVTITNIDVGSYTIELTDAGNCVGTSGGNSSTTETISPATAIVINGSSTDATYAGRANGAIIATVQGGTPVSSGPTYTYSWRSDPVVTIPPATTTNPNINTFEIYLQDLPAATYTLDITDGNGCTESSEFIVSEPPPLVFDTLLNTDVICGDNDATNDDGTISAKATGGIPPYQYQLLRKNELDVFGAYGMPVVLEETQTFESTMLSGGVYQVQLADNTEDPQNTNPVVFSTEIEIIQPQPFFIQNITLEEAQCIGQASGSMTFDILGGTGTYILELLKEGDPAFQRVIENIPHNSMGVTVGDLSRGVYTLNIIDENMCELINPFVQRIVTIKDPSLIYNVDLGNNKVLCKDQTHTVDAFISDPMAHYVWQADNGFSSQDSQITIDKTGLYSVIVTTALGCEITSSIDVVVLDQPILPEFVVPSDLFAKESFILVDVSNPLPDTVEWLVPKEAIVTESSQGYAEIAFEKAGTYELVMKTTIGACEAFATKTIEVRAASFDKKNNGNSELSLYPNPSQGDFTIDLTFEQEAPVDIKLFSMVNNALLYSQTSTAEKIHLVDLNLKGSLSTGVYLLLLQSPEKNYVRKIVVE